MKAVFLVVALYLGGYAGIPPRVPLSTSGVSWSPSSLLYGQAVFDSIDVAAESVKELFEAHGCKFEIDLDENDAIHFVDWHLCFDTLGFIAMQTHGWYSDNHSIGVEAYSTHAELDSAYLRLWAHWQCEGIGEGFCLFNEDKDTVWAVLLYDTFISGSGYVHLTEGEPVVLLAACNGATGSQSVCDAFRDPEVGASATLGYACTDTALEATQALRMVWQYFLGSPALPPAGGARNLSIADATEAYQQNPPEGHDFYEYLTQEGDGNVRAYNSPRIVGVWVRGTDTTAYHYGYSENGNPPDYPYNPGNNTPYPGNLAGARTNPATLDDTVKVRLLFSAEMDTCSDSFDIEVKPESSQYMVTCHDSGWGGVVFDNQEWVGWFVIPHDSWPTKVVDGHAIPQDAVLHVSARDAFKGDLNSTLDTDGDGSANGTDVNHFFHVKAVNHKVIPTNPHPQGQQWSVKRYMRYNEDPAFTITPTLNLKNLGSHNDGNDSVPVVCWVLDGDDTVYVDTAKVSVKRDSTKTAGLGTWYCGYGSVDPGEYEAVFFHCAPGDTHPKDDTVRVDFIIKDTSDGDCSPYADIDEGFESAWPDSYPDWYARHVSVHGSCWHQVREGGNGMMKLSWHCYSLSYDSLWTPAVNIENADSLVVQLNQSYSIGQNPDDPYHYHRFVMVGMDPQHLYPDTLVIDSCPGTENRYKVALPWGDKKRVRLCWMHFGDWDDTNFWTVDNVSVTRYPILDRDVVVQAIYEPNGEVCGGATITPAVVLRNCGKAEEFCTIVLKIGDVYCDTQNAFVPVGVRMTVDFELPWVAETSAHSATAFIDWGEYPDFCPTNDTLTANVSVLNNEFTTEGDYPLGKTKVGFAMAGFDGGVVIRGQKAGGSNTVTYKWVPSPVRNWDTLATFKIGDQYPKREGGGIVAAGGLLFATYRGNKRAQCLARLDTATNVWSFVNTTGLSEKVKLAGPLCWDGQDRIYALNFQPPAESSPAWKRNIVYYSITSNSWTYFDTLPRKVVTRKNRFGMAYLDGALYILGFSRATDQPSTSFWRYRLDSKQYDSLAGFPQSGSRVNKKALSMVECGGNLFVVSDPSGCSGAYVYDVVQGTWLLLKGTPAPLQNGAELGRFGDYLYLLPGQNKYLYRYFLPEGYIPPASPFHPTAGGWTRRPLGPVDSEHGTELLVDTSDTDLDVTSWAADNSRFCTVKEDDTGAVNLFVCPIGASPELLPLGLCVSQPQWAPDSDWIAFLAEDNSSAIELWKCRPDGTGLVQLTQDGRDKDAPRWSMDSQSLVFSCTDNDASKICRGNADGTGLTELTSSSDGWAEHPSFLPDSMVVYEASDDSGKSDVWLMKWDGSGKSKLSQGEAGDCTQPCVSPDGQRCVYVKTTNVGDVLCVDTTGAAMPAESIVSASYDDYAYPTFTPDGRYVIFVASQPSQARVIEVDLVTSALSELAGNAEERGPVAISHDGRWLSGQMTDSVAGDAHSYRLRRFLGDSISVFQLDKGAFDATRDSVQVDFSIEGAADVSLLMKHSDTTVRTLINTHLAAGDYTYIWNGRRDNGALALPGSYLVALTAAGSGWGGACSSAVQVKGTLAPATIASNTTWTAANEPYVLSGHSLDINQASGSATLTIQPGVRVMFADSGVSRSIIVHEDDSIAANGTAQDSVYFMPYRKMAEAYSPAKRGRWGGLDFLGSSNGGQFSYCVFENGGNCDPPAVICPHTTNSGTIADLDHCLFRGSLGYAIRPYNGDARNRFDADSCAFEYCASYPICDVRAIDVAGICATCTFANNDMAGLYVHNTENSEHIQTSGTWPCMSPGWHYDLDGSLQVWSNSGYPVLTLGAGATIRMPYNGEIRIGYHNGATVYPGALEANGTPGAPVSFVGSNGPSWYGLHLDWDPSGYTSFSYCIFEDGVGQSRLTEGGVSYYPMLYCEGASPDVYRCKFLYGTRQSDTERGTGLYMVESQADVSECKFIKNEVGILADFQNVPSCTTTNCLIDSGQYGVLVTATDDNSQVCVRNSNMLGNSMYGVANLDNNHAYVMANHNWWGPNGQGQNRGRPGWLGNNDVPPFVTADTWDTAAFTIWSMDAQAVSILTPVGWLVPGAVEPQAVVSNHLDTTVLFTATLGIGAVYRESVAETLGANATDTLVFPQGVLDSGWYGLGLAVDLMGDEDTTNDSVSDTVWVRDSVDAAAIAVLAPPAQITVDDTIEPRVSVANYGAIARQIRVKFYLDTVYQVTESALVAARETAEVSFDGRLFRPGTHAVMFVASLPLDDDRANDTARANVSVNAGDYWVAEDSPPYVDARLCWDRGQYVYAAQRNGAGVRRYNTGTNAWSSVASAPVESILGITSLKGRVYALGRGAGTDQGEGRSQTLETRVQNDPQSANRPKARSQDPKVEAAKGGAFANELGIYRYDAAGDSWVLVTTCDTALVPGNGSALAGDDAGSLYLIEGGSDRVLRYIVAQDSWVSDIAPSVIDQWGAAAWSRGKLYALANADSLLEYDVESDQWAAVPQPGTGTYGTALCADPVLDRLYAFHSADPTDGGPHVSGRQQAFSGGGRFRERWNRTQTWIERGPELADTAGASLCFAGTQAYCLDGYGGFWRYRPEPTLDAAAVAKAIPDTVPRDTLIVPAGIVQNSWQDTLQFNVHMAVGSYSSSRTDTVPPQRWDTLSFQSTSFNAGTYPITLTVSLDSEQYHYNDTAFGSLFVRYRRDAEALSVASPEGRIPYDNQITPSGRVRNNSDSALTAWVSMTIASEYADSVLVALPPQADSSIVFDTCHLRIGEYQAVLRVHYDGDEVPGNDTAQSSVEVVSGDYWKVLAQCPDNEVRLVASPGSEVYSVKRSGTNFRYYDAAQDTWEDKAASPLSSNLSLCRYGNKVYALGLFGDMDAAPSIGLGHDSKSQAGTVPADLGQSAKVKLQDAKWQSKQNPGLTDGPPAIVRYDVNTDAWDTVSAPLPFSVGEGSCLFATDSATLFVLGDGTNNLWRYDATQDIWVPMTPMPGLVSSWASGANDNAGHFYVLTDYIGKLRRYSVTGNSWDSLTPLNGATPSGSALCCDAAKNRLYALWAGNGPGAYCYDIAGHAWTEVEFYPSTLSLPALAQSGSSPFGQNGTTFAKYVPEPEVDVAALAILVPGDTERYDSAVAPTGEVCNSSQVPVWCQATFVVGNETLQSPALYLEPTQTDMVVFDSVFLPPGPVTAKLHVTCTGDANLGNDTCSKSVQVEAPWEPRQAPAFAKGRLDADTGVAVYAADRISPNVFKYQVAQDSWLQLPNAPFSVGTADLSYHDGVLYALGMVEADRPGDGRPGLAGKGSTALMATPAIFRMAVGGTAWSLVTDSLPSVPNLAVSWIVATADGIYLVPGQTQDFYRYDTLNGWQAVGSVPRPVQAPLALDWDRDDAMFLLTHVATDTTAFFQYSLSGDTWATLPRLPVDADSAVALAAEPTGDWVLALVPGDSVHAWLYGYDRSQDTWVQKQSPAWNVADGEALTYAGTQAYALTGQPTTQPSWFWCYDPGFAAYWGRGMEGVAGKPLPVLRWQLTCSPNPLSARAIIRWQVPRLSSVSLKVYNAAGQMVSVLAQGTVKPGSYTTTWNGCDRQRRRLAAGVYVCTLDGPGARLTRKVVLTE